MKTTRISLADFIAGVREELELAVRRQKNRSESSLESVVPPMKVNRIVLETEVVITQGDTKEGKIGYWIASVGGKKQSGGSMTQKVVIELDVEAYLGT